MFYFVYLLLSSRLPLLAAVPLWSSFSFWWPFPSSLSVMALSFLGGFSSYSVGSLSLWLFHCSLPPPLLLGFPSVRPPRPLFFASFGYVLAFFLFASFVTRSNLSSFAKESSLREESPLSVVAYSISPGLGSCPLVFGTLPLLDILLSFLLLSEWVTLLFIVSFLEFFYLSLFVEDLHFPVCICFCFSYCLLLLSPLGDFLSSLLMQLPFSLVLFTCGCSCVIHLLYFVVLSFLIVGGETLVSSLASSLRSSASILQCLLGRCAWRRPLSPLVRCVHGDNSTSSPTLGPLRLAHPSIPAGPMCPWDSVACPLPYRLLY